MKQELNTIFALALREVLHFMRDKARIAVTFVFPIVFIGVLGAGLESNLKEAAGYSFIVFAFTGVLGQILFQTTALGVIALSHERHENLTQESFVAPVSRHSIILGKIIGESIVALLQCVGVILFGSLIGIPITLHQIVTLIPVFFVACLLGGSFGLIVLSQISSPKGIQEIFPLLIVPQIFLAGVFSPIKDLPIHVLALSRAMPMTYAVDLVRSIYYRNAPEFEKVVLYDTRWDLLVAFCFILIFLFLGTYLFVKNERNR